MALTKKVPDSIFKLHNFRCQDKEASGEDCSASAETDPTGTGNAKVLEAIASYQTTLTLKIEKVKVDMSLISQDFQKMRDRVREAENRLDNVKDSLPFLQDVSYCLQLQVSQILQKKANMENRLFRSNLYFIGLPEGVEGPDTATFLE